MKRAAGITRTRVFKTSVGEAWHHRIVAVRASRGLEEVVIAKGGVAARLAHHRTHSRVVDCCRIVEKKDIGVRKAGAGNLVIVDGRLENSVNFGGAQIVVGARDGRGANQ